MVRRKPAPPEPCKMCGGAVQSIARESTGDVPVTLCEGCAKVMESVAEVVPGAADRMAAARLASAYSSVVAEVYSTLLRLDPALVYAVLKPDDLPLWRAFLTDLEQWAQNARMADALQPTDLMRTPPAEAQQSTEPEPR